MLSLPRSVKAARELPSARNGRDAGLSTLSTVPVDVYAPDRRRAEFVSALVADRPWPTNRRRARLVVHRLRPRPLPTRGLALSPRLRFIVVALLLALTAAVAAGCGSTAAPTLATNSFVNCLPSTLAVDGGQIEGLSVEGTTCQVGERVMAAVIAGLNAGKGSGGYPELVYGWNCSSNDGNQTTCTRGRDTLYAQYALP